MIIADIRQTAQVRHPWLSTPVHDSYLNRYQNNSILLVRPKFNQDLLFDCNYTFSQFSLGSWYMSSSYWKDALTLFCCTIMTKNLCFGRNSRTIFLEGKSKERFLAVQDSSIGDIVSEWDRLLISAEQSRAEQSRQWFRFRFRLVDTSRHWLQWLQRQRFRFRLVDTRRH